MEDEDEDDNSKRVKFNWEDTIATVLKSKGEISLKKLKKKVTLFIIKNAVFT